MRIVFMGTPQFAVPSLRALSGAHEVVAVYTRPDAVSSRGSRASASLVKETAVEIGIPVMQPTTLRDSEAARALRALAADLIVVVAYGAILPIEVMAAAPLGAVNAHASLLPRWRGAAPVQRAILAGDTITGVSIMRVEEGLDTGPYCLQQVVEIDDKYAGELSEELSEAAGDALLDALAMIESGECIWTEQPPEGVTYAEKVTKSEITLSPELKADHAWLRVRASTRQAPARATVGGKGLTVIHAEKVDVRLSRGEAVAAGGGVLIGFDDGTLKLTRIKPDGKQMMSAADWWAGARFAGAVSWDAPA